MTDSLAMQCVACGHRWQRPLALPMKLFRFAGELKQISCPRCAADWRSLKCQFGKTVIEEAVHK
jgi:hypothetical protein